MFKDNPLLAQLKAQIVENLPTVEGRVKASDKSYGFLQCDGNKSYFIAPPFMKNLIHGDLIKASLHEQGKKTSAEPQELLQPSLSQFIGQVQFINGKCRIVPEHRQINRDLPARSVDPKTLKLEQGDWVKAKLSSHALTDKQFAVIVESLVAKQDDPLARWKIVTAKHDLAWDEPESSETTLEVEQVSSRVDLRHMPWFTIDGLHTKDMDDAIHISDQSDHWRLSVAIADPSAYVSEGHPLNQVAKDRCFTLYLPGKTVPMLPENLANQTCSLLPGEDKLALVCHMKIEKTGLLKPDFEFELATIRSHQRLDYTSVSNLIENQLDLDLVPGIEAQLQQLAEFSRQRIEWRQQHSTVFKSRPDYSFELSEYGELLDIHCQPRRIANSMVEEAMVAANAAAGQFLSQQQRQAVYSVHCGFKTESIDALLKFLEKNGYCYSAQELQTLSGFCELRRQVEARGDVANEVLLRRFYNQSEFANDSQAHFGLGEAAYASWTSPIRKYGDMLNHRIIKAAILEQSNEAPLTEELSQHMSEQRRKHKFAEREMADYLYTQYYAMLKVGSKLKAEIMDVNRAGLKLQFMDTGARGFLPASLMSDAKDVLVFETDTGCIVQGESVKLCLGETIEVILHDVRIENQNITVRLEKPYSNTPN
ncbi:exoribonuclease II [Alginatibacterium sediminis]|uniref:Exoribonuclease II n=2 Tax=Alginatibacterium sediminis TaxID=2164068 RepID=A0A420EHF4_9ALTE|nr:exoribonuclease II [Alginatibacterium sediminis]